jgi:hypothetical protein
MHSSRSHHAVIRVYDAAGNVIETHQHKRGFSGRSARATHVHYTSILNLRSRSPINEPLRCYGVRKILPV